MIPLDGIPIIVDRSMGPRIQFRFPRTKNRRIRAKWRKDPRNWRGGIGTGLGVMMFGTYYVSPEGMRALRKAVARQQTVPA